MQCIYVGIPGDSVSGDVSKVCFKVDIKSMKGLVQQLYVQCFSRFNKDFSRGFRPVIVSSLA